jgi:hypothetical protein
LPLRLFKRIGGIKKTAISLGLNEHDPVGAAPTEGHGRPCVTAFEDASTHDFGAYVFDHAKVFLRTSQVRDLKFLTYLLEMVAVEAARLRDEQ